MDFFDYDSLGVCHTCVIVRARKKDVRKAILAATKIICPVFTPTESFPLFCITPHADLHISRKKCRHK